AGTNGSSKSESEPYCRVKLAKFLATQSRDSIAEIGLWDREDRIQIRYAPLRQAVLRPQQNLRRNPTNSRSYGRFRHHGANRVGLVAR
ncbi:MAG TPA: hypothetical protein VEF07_12425, partial [Candidatus Binataceae bacterium]|nr:hypothetical protein [Candidatus Binataceae bacterium]